MVAIYLIAKKIIQVETKTLEDNEFINISCQLEIKYFITA